MYIVDNLGTHVGVTLGASPGASLRYSIKASL